MAALEVRVKTHAQNSAAIVATRMAISADEMSTGRGYDYSSAPSTFARTRQHALADFGNRLRAG